MNNSMEINDWSKNSLCKYKQEDHDKKWVFRYYDIGVVIYDKFPKSKVHLLFLPYDLVKEHTQQRVLDYTVDNMSKILAVHNICRDIVKEKVLEDNSLNFLVGYHINPTMDDLHIHIISTDFCNVKQKRKLKSYNDNNFITIDNVEYLLTKYGRIVEPVQKYIKHSIMAPPLVENGLVEAQKEITVASSKKKYIADYNSFFNKSIMHSTSAALKVHSIVNYAN